MIWADYAILGLIALSAVLSLFRGFVKEMMSLLAWVAAFWVALRFAHVTAEMFLGAVSVPSLRLGLAYLILFVGTLLVGALISYALGQLVKNSPLTAADRSLGLIFGGLRGVVLVTILVVLLGMTPMRQDPWWSESFFIVKFEGLAQWSLDQVPEDIAARFRELKSDLPQMPAGG